MRLVAIAVLLAACGGASGSPAAAPAADPLSNHVDTPPPPPPVDADPAKLGQARVEAKQLAYEAYPQWSAAHPSRACPDKLDDLLEFVSIQGLDPWKHRYAVYCGATLPKGVKGILVKSAGPDGKLGTADDLSSLDAGDDPM
jgi:hypothetical protein|nr:hypothetical protein [Kofleriaceae bacterium]